MDSQKNDVAGKRLTRRDFVRLTSVGATALGAGLAFADSSVAEAEQVSAVVPKLAGSANLYSELLQTWCDGLLKHQVLAIQDSALHGAFLCPACGIVHGRCGDAVYPLLRVAHTTGDEKYLRAALLVHDWSERQVSRADGSWVNDVILSSWQGITVFHAIALGEALHHHGEVLDAKTRAQWTDRLARAAKFLDGFISIETGNINYPVTSSYCFALCGQVLGNAHYVERGRAMAHAAMDYFTPNGFLYGEGHPLKSVSAKGCHPVDLGYNIEESLPALALYSVLTKDQPVMDKVVAALRTHMEFMLPDGAWDNSFGTRNYKWSWWGSRTSDGCQPAFVALASHDPSFLEAARRNTELMAACTHDGLLYGGPDYFAHGDSPCIHHSFTHAKALATVLDRGEGGAEKKERHTLPRDVAYGLKTYPEIGTHLASIGDWRATVTEYDWEYVEQVQSGAGGKGGGHATGGALSILYHQKLGPILTASMTEYQIVEISNQQTHRDKPFMTLTPRIECAGAKTYTSLNDLGAKLTANASAEQVVFEALGQMQTTTHMPLNGARYRLTYTLSKDKVEISAWVSDTAGGPPPTFFLPLISREEERKEILPGDTFRITKPDGKLTVRVDGDKVSAGLLKPTFNLVPGFECIPLAVQMKPGSEIRIRLEAS